MIQQVNGKAKFQQKLKKMKSKLPEKIYKKFYPTRYYRSKFYGNSKIHKLSTNNLDDLTLRPIVFNIGTATYEAAKLLANLLAP